MGALKLEDVNYTYDDYKLWDGEWELMGGVPLSMSPAPMRKHQGLSSEIIFHISGRPVRTFYCKLKQAKN